MASDKIKGLTVKIGADTSDFIKQLKKVDKEINYSEKQARELQKQLEFKFDEKTFLAAQAKVRDDLDATEQKAKAIKQQLKYLEDSGGIDSKGYKDLQVELEKNTTQAMKLNAELKKLDDIKFENSFKGIKTLSSNLETAAKKTAVLSASAIGAIAGITKLVSSTATAGAEIQDMADRLGVSAEAIQRYDYIALQSGVDTEQLAKSMAKARDAIGTALAGTTNTATTALQNLFGDLKNIPTDTEAGFTAIIDQLSEVEDSTLQAYYANEIFGEKLATNLIPMINNGADKLKKLNAEFEAIGYLSNESVQNLADFDDELNIMKERLELVKIELGMALKPMLEMIVNFIENNVVPALQKLSGWINGLTEDQQEMILKALLLVSALSPVLKILSSMIGLLPALMTSLNGINGILGAISSHPIIAIIGLIAMLILILYTRNEEFKESINELLDVLNRSAMPVIDLISSALEDIIGLLTPLIDMLGSDLAEGIRLITTLLEPVVEILEVIFDLIGKITDGFMMLVGKGWLWGEEDEKPKVNKETKKTSSGSIDYSSVLNEYGLTMPTDNNVSNYTDNSNLNINITLNATGNLEYDTKELADSVIKEIITKKQASGRY